LSSASEPVGTIDVALTHAARLLGKDPSLAAEQAAEVLKAAPGHPHARLIVAQSQRLRGQLEVALAALEPLAREQPRASAVHLELGIVLAELGRLAAAVGALKTATTLKPDSADAWRTLGDALDALGDPQGADQARARSIKAATKDPRLLEAAAALVENKIPVAEARLRTHLRQHPNDVAALRMLAEVAARLRRYGDAEALLERCVDLAPGFDAARANYALILNRQAKTAAALVQVNRLLERDPRNPSYRNLQAAVLANLGSYAESMAVYEQVLKEFPRQPRVWMSYGHSLKTAGRVEDSIAAYRRAIEMQPTLGESYWSMANLKTFRFTTEDLAAMRAALERTDLTDDDRLHFEFSLGKALEDRGSYDESFAHYDQGNALRRKTNPYRATETTGCVRRSKSTYTPEFFAARTGSGAPPPDPIFVLGLPRAGSTLIEQILASHSQVEGTMELPDIPALARELAGREERDEDERYPAMVLELGAEQLRALGERYLAGTRVQRKIGRPFFIDKMPNNWQHVGLIHLLLPNAKIIDARRHPVGCCFSGFKQHFARGQNFSYSLTDIGAYYRDYVDLMAHIDRVLPGRVHRVIYERMVDDTEAEVRRLLEYCCLPFEAGCLRFYENERAVRTASSEQVRQPIFREGVDQWRHFEPWLAPLKSTLGSVLDSYPAVPADLG
jgi:tetratricopeptide (TPR) repeat protein